jgi:hypothetical protein
VVERCSRFQCGAPATARVAFDALGCMVWLDRFDAAGPLDVSARGAGALCTRHADRLVPPRGWAVQDRRGPDLQLWSDRPPAPPEAVRAADTTRGRAPTTPSVAVLEPPLPFDAPAPEADEETDDIDRLLGTPRSPLLARAFNAAHTRQAG